MSGHSKWATTKHQKAVKDARRGKESQQPNGRGEDRQYAAEN
jgi:transcriptional/translational regulatory protein YebC/TACO1